ncbi:hypothetical protein SDC9_123150 [bioreactor metagenome]|uniref:Uncharacterized protein n=1 Tax=bioreactor metagenome TaxID=1076179 RepID=A0A645CGZ8_9ZZZZ
MGLLDQSPLTRVQSARKGALFIAEKLCLQKPLGKGGAADFHQVFVLARAVTVDIGGQNVFTHARLTLDEYAGIHRGHLLRHFQKLLHFLAFVNNFGLAFFPVKLEIDVGNGLVVQGVLPDII